MRQITHCGDSFAISIDETPHPSQCLLILPEGRAECPSDEPQRCRTYRVMNSEYCVAHRDLPVLVAEIHPQCALGVHAWDQLDYPAKARCTRCGEPGDKPQVCCELYVETGHHEPDCREFFHMMHPFDDAAGEPDRGDGT